MMGLLRQLSIPTKRLWQTTFLLVTLFIWEALPPVTAFFLTVFLVWWFFKIDTEILGYVAILLLIIIPILQTLERASQAEQLAVYVYFLLVMIVILEIRQLWNEDAQEHDEDAGKAPGVVEGPREPNSTTPGDTNSSMNISLFITSVQEKMFRFMQRFSRKKILHLWRKYFVRFKSRAYSPFYLKNRARYIVFFMRYKLVLISLGLALLVTYPLFNQGYIFALDLVWTPEMTPVWQTDGTNSTYPLRVLFYIFSLIIPAWVVQKIFLFALVFSLFYFPLRFLPFVYSLTPRLFAALVFALNPFIYTRLISGQWGHAAAYTLLPLFLYVLVNGFTKPSRKQSFLLAGTLLLIGLFSTHFLYITSCVTVFIFAYCVIRYIGSSELLKVRELLHHCARTGIILIIGSLYFTVPALMRTSPLEARFDASYFEAFAAAAHDAISPYTNTLFLGGFWGEDLLWKHMYLWPQDHALFPVVVMILSLIVIVGILYVLRLSLSNRGTLFGGSYETPESRYFLQALLIITPLVYVMALGASDTIFKSLNLFLYEHIPFASGLRDSNKWVSILALSYAVFSGLGLQELPKALERYAPRKVSVYYKQYYGAVWLLVVPVIFGIYMWGGFRGQLVSVDYPLSWQTVQSTISVLPKEEKVLVLPWHGYLTLPFTNNTLVSNPATSFFGRDRIYAGRGIEFAGIRDQEHDVLYETLDSIVRNATLLSKKELLLHLKTFGITHIIVLPHPTIPRANEGLTSWNYFSDDTKAIDTESKQDRVVSWQQMLEGHLEIVSTSTDIILFRVRL